MTASGTFSWSDVALPGGAAAGVVRAGVDRVELDKFRRALDVAGERFLGRIYTPAEIVFCAGAVHRLATRFAAKEAVAKMLGTGFRGLGWREIEVLGSSHGEPRLILRHRALDRAGRLGITSIGVSLTHTDVAAEAFVVALCTGPDCGQWIREEAGDGRA